MGTTRSFLPSERPGRRRIKIQAEQSLKVMFLWSEYRLWESLLLQAVAWRCFWMKLIGLCWVVLLCHNLLVNDLRLWSVLSYGWEPLGLSCFFKKYLWSQMLWPFSCAESLEFLSVQWRALDIKPVMFIESGPQERRDNQTGVFLFLAWFPAFTPGHLGKASDAWQLSILVSSRGIVYVTPSALLNGGVSDNTGHCMPVQPAASLCWQLVPVCWFMTVWTGFPNIVIEFKASYLSSHPSP